MKLIHKYDINHHGATYLYSLFHISMNTKLTNFTTNTNIIKTLGITKHDK